MIRRPAGMQTCSEIINVRIKLYFTLIASGVSLQRAEGEGSAKAAQSCVEGELGKSAEAHQVCEDERTQLHRQGEEVNIASPSYLTTEISRSPTIVMQCIDMQMYIYKA